MAITDKAKEITELIYKAYGSSTGYLFGIPPNLKHAVEAVVQCALDHSRTSVSDLTAPRENEVNNER